MTLRERRPDLSFPLPFHDRSSKLRTYRHFAVEFRDYFLLCVDTLEFIWWLFIRRFVIEFRDKKKLCVDTLIVGLLEGALNERKLTRMLSLSKCISFKGIIMNLPQVIALPVTHFVAIYLLLLKLNCMYLFNMSHLLSFNDQFPRNRNITKKSLIN